MAITIWSASAPLPSRSIEVMSSAFASSKQPRTVVKSLELSLLRFCASFFAAAGLTAPLRPRVFFRVFFLFQMRGEALDRNGARRHDLSSCKQ